MQQIDKSHFIVIKIDRFLPITKFQLFSNEIIDLQWQWDMREKSKITIN